METLHSWMIEELERLRREQEAERPRLFIELPRAPAGHERTETVEEEEEIAIIIPLR